MSDLIYKYNQPFTLESGIVLPGYHLAYTLHGKLNERRDNAVWVFHALTANSDPVQWWPGLVGNGTIFDPSEYFIICVNMPGSCYGSLGPLDKNPATGQPYYHDFPFFTPRDMIRAYQHLKKELGLDRIKIGIGGSMGGQQLLEWAIEEPGLFEYIFPIATNAWHSPWGIAFNASQRACIETDPSWPEKRPDAGIEGMKTARSVALLSYRHYDTYSQSQQEEDMERLVQFRSESYQRYQGEKLASRFNAFSYYKLSQSMDAHQVGRGRTNPQNALQRIRSKALVIGLDTDILFPFTEQQFITLNIHGSSLGKIHSQFGHDGFLLESEQIGRLIGQFIQLKSHSSVKFASTNFENGST